MSAKKMSLANIKEKLSRAEMKQIMAGSGDGNLCAIHGCGCGPAGCVDCPSGCSCGKTDPNTGVAYCQ